MIPERLILFSAGGREFALDLQQVCEVMEPQQSYPVAGVPAHYLGLINFHGNMTALVDLPKFLGVAGVSPGKLLVLDTKLAQLALRVDAVRCIVGEDAVLEAAEAEDPLILATLSTARGPAALIGVEALLSGLEEGLRQPPQRPQP